MANAFKSQFGLQYQPTDVQIKEWAQIVNTHIGTGSSLCEIGSTAAKKVFPNCNINFLPCEADVIETLLHLAGDKGGVNKTNRVRLKVASNVLKSSRKERK